MFDHSSFKRHQFSEEIVEHLSTVTQNTNKHFFRIMLTYFWGTVCSHMRVGIRGWGTSLLPVNIYSVCLSESGTGKGFTINTLEESVLNQFRDTFLNETFLVSAEDNMYNLAASRAVRNSSDVDTEIERLLTEFEKAGPMVFRFSEGTPAAVKQLRHKLCLAKAGALNFQVDEIGSNLLKEKDMINLYLELYDTGRIQDKLVKNTADNMRVERVEGVTPSNALLCGSAATLLDGSETERLFFSLIEVGYGRRCFFAYSREAAKDNQLTAEELVDRMFNPHHEDDMAIKAQHMQDLADISNLNKEMIVSKDTAVYLMQYKLHCEQRSSNFKEHEKALKIEMDNRYFKVLKLAACYSFIDLESEVTIPNIQAAIKIAEESGEDFAKLMRPEKDYMKLAKFLVDYREEATLADLDQYLPCFRGAKAKKDEMITNAVSWGYKNNVLISKRYQDAITFIKAETLQETDLNQLYVSVSNHQAFGYEPEVITFEDLAKFGETPNYHWCNHHFEGGHRSDSTLIPGFNVIVLDVDDGTPIEAACQLLENYYAVIYETKRSTAEHNRYRIVLPISHTLNLSVDDYKELVSNLLSALPFECEVDDASKQPSKKWLTCDKGSYVLDAAEGVKLFDILPYIPRTTKNEQRLERFNVDYANLDKIQAWVIENTGEGNRNKQLFRYAMILVDLGMSYEDIRESLIAVNAAITGALSLKEIEQSILKSVIKKIGNKS